MKIKTETQTGSIVSFDYDNEIAEITGLTTSFEPSQDGTPWMSEVDTAPYLLRKSPDLDHDYNSEIDTLVGGSIAWNQLVANGNFASTSGWTQVGTSLTVSGNVATVVCNSNWARLTQTISIPVGHKILATAQVKKSDSSKEVRILFAKSDTGTPALYKDSAGAGTDWVTLSKVGEVTNAEQNTFAIGSVNTTQTFQARNVYLIDLTATFGTEIADYVYSLEQSTAGSGIAWLKSYGFLTKDYYAYNDGSLVSVKTSEHRTTGKNLLKNKASSSTQNGLTFTVNDDGSVRVSGTATASTYKKINDNFIIPDGNYIVSGMERHGSHYIYLNARKATGGLDYSYGSTNSRENFIADASVHPSYDVGIGVENGTTLDVTFYPMVRRADISDATYEPYTEHSYPLDSDLELRGKFYLDENHNLRSDGDVYPPSGQVQRKYGIVDLGTLDWVYASNVQVFAGIGITDGTTPTPAGEKNIICSKYASYYSGVSVNWGDMPDMSIVQNTTSMSSLQRVCIKDTSKNGDAAALKAALSGVYLVYPLATPTTETADAFASPQIVSPNGTEEYVDIRDVPVPVGHRTTYMLPYPISGWDEAKAYVSPTEEEEDATIYTINLNGTRYGGNIDFFSGVMTITHGFYAITGNENPNWAFSNRSGVQIAYSNLSSIMTGVKTTGGVQQTALFDKFKTSRTAGEARVGDAYVDNGYVNLGFSPNMFATSNDVKAWLRSSNVEVVYELATPLEVQLTAQQIEALQGQNYVWCDSGDTTLTWRHIPVLDEAVMLNGKYLELTIDGYSTLGTSGRRSLGRQLDTYSVGTADGETVKNSTFPSRKITVNYVIQTDTEEELTEAINQLSNILNQDECDFVFRDEPDKYFSGYGLLDSEPKKYRHAVKGTWSLYCAYPFKRSNKLVELSSKDPTVASVDAHSATFVFDYNGTLPAHPILRAEFASAKSGGEYNEDGDCGYVAFLDAEENIIQLGNPEVLDVDQYANATLINREFTSLSGWTASGVAVGDLTDQFWQNGKGQTQSYAKGTGSFTKSVGNGAINMEFDIVHRLCVSAANQTGAFECYAKNGNTIVVGFKIEKTGSGTTGTVSYILNGKVVGTDSIDLSYYNTHFGYCNRTAVYGTEYYSVYEKYYVKKKGKKKKKKYHWVTYPRTVQTGWSYTQSNLNSGWSKDGSVIIFSIGNLADRTFKNSDVELTPSTSIVFNISGSFHTNAVHSCAMLSKAGVPFAEIPNVFTAGDVVEGDCNSADVMLYRKGSLEGHLEPQYGALGNDWEDFEIKPGKNIIRAVWSDWVNTSYKPEIKIIFNEVYV